MRSLLMSTGWVKAMGKRKCQLDITAESPATPWVKKIVSVSLKIMKSQQLDGQLTHFISLYVTRKFVTKRLCLFGHLWKFEFP